MNSSIQFIDFSFFLAVRLIRFVSSTKKQKLHRKLYHVAGLSHTYTSTITRNTATTTEGDGTALTTDDGSVSIESVM